MRNKYNSICEPIVLYEQGDSAKILKQKYADKKFDLIITSPPYNVGKEYETQTSIDEYLKQQEEIIEQIIRVTSDRGSICWQVGNFIDSNKEIYPLDIYYYQIFKKHNLILRNRIIWHFGHGLHTKSRFSGRYEVILWFSKSNDYIFNLDNIRIKSKYPGKRHFKGPNKGNLSGNPNGKNPSDVWDIVLQDWEKEIWEIPNVKANHKEKTEHPCQYPIELVERCILALTNTDSLILDPFAGVGSTLIAALKTKRNAVGIEKYKKYINIGLDRISQFKEGSLKIREIDQPIYDHTKSKLPITPQEFKTKKMKICDIYSHLGAIDKLKSKIGIFDEIESILTDQNLIFGKKNPSEIKSHINYKFNQKGWADKIRVGNSRLTINFLKLKVGVCFQLGNVARTYADILKLAQLGKKNVIEIGIIIVPHKIESKILGANYAQYNRLSAEIKHFQDIINMPILVIGLSN